MNDEKLDLLQAQANRNGINVDVYRLTQEQLKQLEYMLKREVANGR